MWGQKGQWLLVGNTQKPVPAGTVTFLVSFSCFFISSFLHSGLRPALCHTIHFPRTCLLFWHQDSDNLAIGLNFPQDSFIFTPFHWLLHEFYCRHQYSQFHLYARSSIDYWFIATTTSNKLQQMYIHFDSDWPLAVTLHSSFGTIP